MSIATVVRHSITGLRFTASFLAVEVDGVEIARFGGVEGALAQRACDAYNATH